MITSTIMGMVDPNDRLGGMIPIDRLLAVLDSSQYLPFAKWLRARRAQLNPHRHGDFSQIEIEDAVVHYLVDSSNSLGAQRWRQSQ